MCGDEYCRSCGPAQGNYRCLVCGRWLIDGGCKNFAECAEEEEKLVAKLEKMEAYEPTPLEGRDSDGD